MVDVVDARIPMQVQPSGVDLGKMIAGAQQLMQVRQQGEEIQRQNALRDVLGNPQAFDPMGQLKPETMSKVMSIDPNTGLKLQQNQLVTKQRQMQMDAMNTKSAFEQSQYLDEAFAPILQQYKDNIAKGMAEPMARRQAQDQTTETTKRISEGGYLPPTAVRNLPTQFDPIKFEQSAMNTQLYQTRYREDLQRKREEDQNKRAGTTTGTDTDAKPFILQPQGGLGGAPKAIYLDGTPVPPEKLGGAHVGKGGGPKVEDIAVNGERTQGVLRGTKWFDRDGNPFPDDAKIERVGRVSGSDRLGLTPETVEQEADYYNKTGVLKAGYSRADRQAIQNEATKQRREQATTTGDRLASAGTIKADTGSLGTLSKQRDAISAYEKGAEGEFNLALKNIPKTPEPLNMQLLTQWVRTGERQFGDVPNAKFYTYLTSALDEYAKVIGGGYGAASSSDSARRLALSMLPPGATTGQIKGVIEAIKEGMQVKRNGYQEQIGIIQDRLRDKKPEVSGPAGEQPAGSTNWPAPPARAVDRLKANPAEAEQFDHVFGPGASEKVLKANAPAQPVAPSAQTPAGQPTSLAPPKPAAAGPRSDSTLPPNGIEAPPNLARYPDGQTFGGGKYVKRGGRIYMNTGAAPSAPTTD